MTGMRYPVIRANGNVGEIVLKTATTFVRCYDFPEFNLSKISQRDYDAEPFTSVILLGRMEIKTELNPRMFTNLTFYVDANFEKMLGAETRLVVIKNFIRDRAHWFYSYADRVELP